MTGVVLGVAALIVVLSVMNGFFQFVQELLVSYDPHVRIVDASGDPFSADDELLADLASMPNVVSAARYVQGKALLIPAGGAELNKIVVVRGISAGVDHRFAVGMDLGEYGLRRNDRGQPGIIVGGALASRFGLIPGGSQASTVAVMSAQSVERMLTQVLPGANLSQYEVRGVFDVEPVYDESIVFVDLVEAQRLFRMPGQVSGIELVLTDAELAQSVKREVSGRLVEAGLIAETWYDQQRSLYDVMRLEKWGASLVLLLIIVVAAFNLVGSMTMVVIEKRRDVGVLQAMGVSRANIKRIFLIEGLLVGALGAGGGMMIGVGLVYLQDRIQLFPLPGAESFLIDAYPVSLQALDVLLVAVAAIALCVLASIYPAARAAAVEPAAAVAIDG